MSYDHQQTFPVFETLWAVPGLYRILIWVSVRAVTTLYNPQPPKHI